jgi:hypothetical protein
VTPPERVVIRSRFWPRFLRWAVGWQLLISLFAVLVVLARGLNGRPLGSPHEVPALGVTSAVFALIALGLAVRRRNVDAAEITPDGVLPQEIWGGWARVYPWAAIESVRVRSGIVGNRWLEVVPTGGPKFIVTASPTDPAGVLDALERFAGQDHPLTLAFAHEER